MSIFKSNFEVLVLLSLSIHLLANPLRVKATTYQNYFVKYGFASTITNDKQYSDAISNFQSRYHMRVTGILDSNTELLLKTPRCGNKDEHPQSRRSKNYALEGSKWQKNYLTYRIVRYSTSLTRYQVERSFKMAFNQWQSTSMLKFKRVSKSSDIEIQFRKGNHGDNNPFDNVVLAHSYYPRLGGAVHMNDAKQWVTGRTMGDQINLYQVALHELGHVMGLMHSDVTDAIMQPYYSHYIPGRHIGFDDIVAMDFLYNK